MPLTSIYAYTRRSVRAKLVPYCHPDMHLVTAVVNTAYVYCICIFSDFKQPLFLVRANVTLDHDPVGNINIEKMTQFPFPRWHLDDISSEGATWMYWQEFTRDSQRIQRPRHLLVISCCLCDIWNDSQQGFSTTGTCIHFHRCTCGHGHVTI